MKKAILFLLLFITTINLFAQSEVMQWVKQIKGYGTNIGYRIEVDQNQHIYIAGNFSGTTDFDPGPAVMNLTSAFYTNAYILKLDQNGNFLWVKTFSGNGYESVRDFKVDLSGNVYLVGSFDSMIDMDPGPGVVNFTSYGYADIFISKLDASGNFVWAKQLGGIQSEAVNAIALDYDGHFYITGKFNGLFDADPGAVVNMISPVTNGNFDVFIEKYDFAGNLSWVKHTGGTGQDQVTSIALDQYKNVYYAGSFEDSADIDPGPNMFQFNSWPNPNNQNVDAFFSKLDSNGNFVWAKQLVGDSNPGEYIADILVSDSDHVFLTGYFSYTIDFDPGPNVFNLYSPPLAFGTNSDTYVAKYTLAGEFIWVKQLAGTNHTFVEDMVLDSIENIYCIGHFWDTTDFDPGPGYYLKHSNGNRDIFIVKLDAAGDLQWAKTMGGKLGDGANSIARDQWGNIYTTGYFHDTVDFDFNVGVYNLVEQGTSWDGFIHKLAQCDININTLVNNNIITAQAINSTFQWLDCNAGYAPIFGETNAVFTPIINGSYAVEVSVGNCIDTSVCINISKIVGLVEVQHLDDIKIFPNPTEGIFSIEIPSDASIQIWNMLGELVCKNYYTKGNHFVDIGSMVNGIYSVRIITKEKSERRIIVKCH